LRITAWARARWSSQRAIVYGITLMGAALVYPFEMDTVVSLSGGRLVATYYGLYNTASSIVIARGNVATGAVWDAAAGQLRLLWLALSAVGAAAVGALAHTGRLRPAEPRTVAEPAAAG
jgi:hypothetical protein